MKTKKDRQFYIDRAIDNFKTLVIYFCVTRPQFEKSYKVNGKFSIDELLKQMDFVSRWDNQTKDFQKHNHSIYTKYSAAFNYTFGMPSRLVEKVLGCYRDENGKQVRVSIDDVLAPLLKTNQLKILNDGRKIDYKTHQVKCWWDKKYLLANRDYWLKLIADKRYSDINTYPNASPIVKKAVFNWLASKSKKEAPVNIEQKPHNEQPKYRPLSMRDFIISFAKGIIREMDFRILSKHLFGMSQESIEKVIGHFNNIPATAPEAHVKYVWGCLYHGNIPALKNLNEDIVRMVKSHIA